jgi:hypothetical protein
MSSKQVASLLETYLIRDVSKIVYQYFFGGWDAFFYGGPEFSLCVENISDSIGHYEDIFDGGFVINNNYEEVAQFLKTSPETFWQESNGTMNYSSDHLTLTFQESFPLSAKYGYSNDMVFFIVETLTNQVLFSYFPHAYQKMENGQRGQDCYMHEAFQPEPYSDQRCAQTHFKFNSYSDTLFRVEHEKTIIKLYFSDKIREFTSKFDSKYPL